uniref:Uncharacterized protein n=1 Tax=Heterosigma akashiwo TaxID=2829 RepID=A0A7S3Y925_HETAK|mmetsp:Transcript_6476/g.8978  ORF Transcript_6476/g.8978 Transcript_6476/m.8978 type:complete len:100 (-) Transcript_6476:109-408(-)
MITKKHSVSSYPDYIMIPHFHSSSAVMLSLQLVDALKSHVREEQRHSLLFTTVFLIWAVIVIIFIIVIIIHVILVINPTLLYYFPNPPVVLAAVFLIES